MDATCSSVIIDEVVQGRVYANSGANYFLFTLLSAPGNVLPPFNADIFSRPWQLCWRSQEADILELGKQGDSVHCFAIRTQISENDAWRMVKGSKAFANPVSIPKKQPGRWIYVNVGIVLVSLGILIALTLFYTFKGNDPKASDLSPASPAIKGAASINYYLLYHRQISGPYTGKTIADMSAGGLLNATTMCRAENSTEWISLAKIVPAPIAP